MTDKTTLGDRMKGYENVLRHYLPGRTYTIIRLDGRAFHTWTKDLERPYDQRMHDVMHLTTIALCSQISGVQIAYHQSDEISLLLTDFATIETQPWFGGNIQKLVSVSASIATAYFNMYAKIFFKEERAIATFDSRVFTIPEQVEVYNYFLWRFRDAMRNSIQAAGQAHFLHKTLHGKNTSEVQEMLFQQKGINWSEYPEWNKNGTFLFRQGVPGQLDGSVGDTGFFAHFLNLREDSEKTILQDLIPFPNVFNREEISI